MSVGGTAATLTLPEPTDRRALVAIDLGAESCRVSLLRWSAEGPRIQLVHRFANHAAERADGLRWDLGCILDGLHTGLRLCAEIAQEGVRSIAVDGWAVDYVRLNASGMAIADPFCYRDERTVAAEPALHERLSAERMREITGLQLLRINSVYQMFADDAEQKRRCWLNLPEYVLHRLGGDAVSERTNATHTQMVGLDGEWSREIFEAIGQSLLEAPPIVSPGTDIGEVQGELALLPVFAKTRLIAPACHDTASAIAAIPDPGDDWAYISSGTWSLVGTQLKTPVNSTAAREENFTNLGGVDGTVCFHKNVNGMWLLRQCLESWRERGTTLDLTELVAASEGFSPREYVLHVDDPDLMLQGHMPERINTQLRRRGLAELSPEAKDAAEMASFLFHSLAARYAHVLRSVAEITGKRLRRLYMMGGGSQNDFLNRLTAKATGLEVLKAGTECSTLGNFAVQLATLEKTGETSSRPACIWAGRLAKVQQV
jgi:rhamnulokinase